VKSSATGSPSHSSTSTASDLFLTGPAGSQILKRNGKSSGSSHRCFRGEAKKMGKVDFLGRDPYPDRDRVHIVPRGHR